MTWLRNALTLCGRVFLLFWIVVVSGLLVLYQLFPDIKQLQPELETVVQQELQLSSLQMGEVSWTWGWHIGIAIKQASFEQKSMGLLVENMSLKVNLALRDLLHGQLKPLSLQVQGGDAYIHVPESWSSATQGLKPMDMRMSDVRLHWFWKQESGVLKLQSLNILPALREVRLKTPQIQGVLGYNQDFQPQKIQCYMQSLHDVPAAWRKVLQGQVAIHLQAELFHEKGHDVWQGSFQVQGKQAKLNFKYPYFQLPFESMQAHIRWDADNLLKPSYWSLQDVNWRYRKNKFQADVGYQDAHLKVTAHAGHIAMPLLWSWLQPLDDSKAWRQWLKSMHVGLAKDVEVHLDLPWQNFPQPPNDDVWQGLQYRVQGDVYDADISLGEKGLLKHTQAHVDLNEYGLRASIHQSQLPHGAGKVHGTLRVPWEPLVIDVKGQGEVDVQRLQAWSENHSEGNLSWLEAAHANADFALQWLPSSGDFKSLSTQLSPVKPWHIRLHDYPFWVDSGLLTWDMQRGLTAERLHIHDAYMKAVIDFSAQQGQSGKWTLSHMQSDVEGSLETWVKRYDLPIVSPSGIWHSQLTYDGKLWQGDLQLKDAAWVHALGSHKAKGVPWRLHYRGMMQKQEFHLQDMFSEQAPLQLNAYGTLSRTHIQLHIGNIKTDALDAQVDLDIPLQQGVWDIRVSGAYLNRRILPEALPHVDAVQQHPWHLLADIQRVDWQQTRMQSVYLDMSSDENKTSLLKVARMNAKTLSLKDMQAQFYVLQGGRLDVSQLSAMLQDDTITMSAIFAPDPSGGMKWKGYAQMNGSLGLLMQQAKLSKLLAGGQMHAVFLGEGFLFRNQPWWQGLRGRLRIHSENGEVLMGGTLTKFLAALSWMDLPRYLLARRPDLTREGLVYKHLRLESTLRDDNVTIQYMALDSSAVDVTGHGSLNVDTNDINIMLVAQPFQSIDAVLDHLPIVGYALGGRGHSIFRRAYHVYGPLADAQVDTVSPKDAGAPSSGLIDRFLNIPDAWFGERKAVKP